MLNVRQIRGNPEALDGRLTVYARIETDPSDLASANHPVASMVHNGLLAAQGNYRDQFSLRDFLRSEMGVSLEEGLEQLLSRMDGLESALDPGKLKDKLQEMEGMEEFIPTPAKLVAFHSEAEIAQQEGDVFCTGDFRSIGNAVLSVNAFPILYQARYREQMLDNVRNEIERLVGQIEQSGPVADTCMAPGIDVGRRLTADFFPRLLYSRKDPAALEAAEKQFAAFMEGYAEWGDVRAVIEILHTPHELTRRHYLLLELYARKMSAFCRHDVSEVEKAASEIVDVETGASGIS